MKLSLSFRQGVRELYIFFHNFSKTNWSAEVTRIPKTSIWKDQPGFLAGASAGEKFELQEELEGAHAVGIWGPDQDSAWHGQSCQDGVKSYPSLLSC